MKKRIWLLSFFLLFLTVVKAQGYKPGDEARDFKLKNVDGKLLSLSDYKQAKGFIVIFICNPCPYVKLYEQRILELNNKYAPLGYPVIAINPNDAELSKADAFDKMQERARERRYTFPYLVDETQEIAKAYGAKATPHTYVLKKQDGKLIVEYVGAIDNDTEDTNTVKIKYVENAVSAIQKGQKPDVTTTKAIGCGIKWKKA